MVAANAEKIDMNVMAIEANSDAIAMGGSGMGGMGVELTSLSMAVSTNEEGISTLEEVDAMTMMSLEAKTEMMSMNMMNIMANSDAISETMESIGPLVFQSGANQL